MKQVLKFSILTILFGIISLAGANNKCCKKNQSECLTEKTWTITEIVGKQITTVEKENMPYITFNPSGEYNGYSGCNNFFGSYIKENGNLTINPGGMTKKMCMDQANKIESEVVKNLFGTFEYKINKKEMTLSKDGKTVIVLKIK